MSDRKLMTLLVTSVFGAGFWVLPGLIMPMSHSTRPDQSQNGTITTVYATGEWHYGHLGQITGCYNPVSKTLNITEYFPLFGISRSIEARRKENQSEKTWEITFFSDDGKTYDQEGLNIYPGVATKAQRLLNLSLRQMIAAEVNLKAKLNQELN